MAYAGVEGAVPLRPALPAQGKDLLGCLAVSIVPRWQQLPGAQCGLTWAFCAVPLPLLTSSVAGLADFLKLANQETARLWQM